MHEHRATVAWTRGGTVFTDLRYSRRHTWTFDGGAVVAASASPHVVPVPCSDPSAVDPEEAFVAALASCHMLTFLGLAARAGYVVESYEDAAIGCLERDASGREAVTRARLRPRIRFAASRTPSPAALTDLHEEAHRLCFLANSVTTRLTVEERA